MFRWAGTSEQIPLKLPSLAFELEEAFKPVNSENRWAEKVKQPAAQQFILFFQR